MSEIKIEVTGTKEVLDNLDWMAREHPALIAAGLNREVLKIAKVAIRKTPMQYGNLRGSQYVNKAEISKDAITAEIGYRANYAAYVHEMLDPKVRWTQPGTGPKFLESPALAAAPDALRNISDYVTKKLEAQFRKSVGNLGGRFT